MIPLTNLRSYLLQTEKRVLICAETAGRRETLQQYFRDFELDISICEDYTDFLTSSAKLVSGRCTYPCRLSITGYCFHH